jgi:polar amino acid transport system permease protein
MMALGPAGPGPGEAGTVTLEVNAPRHSLAQPPSASPPSWIRAKPVRHYGRWLSAAALLYLAFALIWSLAHNPIMDWQTVGEYMLKGLTLRGLVVTIELTVIAMAIGILGGTLLAVMRLSDNPVLSSMAWFYIWFFRGTPVLVQILFWAFLGALYPRLFCGIPFTGVVFGSAATSSVIGAFAAGILALGLNEAAYASELVRAGIIAVDTGQRKAALSLGMSNALTLRYVVLPQAMRVVIPPMGNETIGMLKTTSLVSVIAGSDLLTNLQKAYAQNYQIIPLLVVASLWYLLLTTLLSVGQYYLEKHFGKGFGMLDASKAESRSWQKGAAGASS